MATRKAKTATETVQPVEAAPVVFTKRKALTFSRYRNRRDLLSILLKDGQNYTFDEVDSLIEQFMMER